MIFFPLIGTANVPYYRSRSMEDRTAGIFSRIALKASDHATAQELRNYAERQLGRKVTTAEISHLVKGKSSFSLTGLSLCRRTFMMDTQIMFKKMQRIWLQTFSCFVFIFFQISGRRSINCAEDTLILIRI